MAGAAGFEPANTATKKRCLRPLGYAPTDALASSGEHKTNRRGAQGPEQGFYSTFSIVFGFSRFG